jgi:hypothetical protein
MHFLHYFSFPKIFVLTTTLDGDTQTLLCKSSPQFPDGGIAIFKNNFPTNLLGSILMVKKKLINKIWPISPI